MLQVIFSLSLTAMLLILLISREKIKSAEMTSNFMRMLQIIIIFFIIFKVTIYLASVEDNKIFVYFVEYQNIELSAILIKNSVVDFSSCKFTS